MENLLQVLKTEDYLVISCIVNIILVIVTMINVIMLTKINKKYIKFMKQLGNGSNLDEMLRDYLRDVKEIKQDNSEIKAYYTKLDSDIASCIQKVGLVRYNAFRDVGSDLSFAIALLDGNDTGVVLMAYMDLNHLIFMQNQ